MGANNYYCQALSTAFSLPSQVHYILILGSKDEDLNEIKALLPG